MISEHEFYMSLALQEANKAFEANEVPVGALIVYHNEIIARAFNKKESDRDSTSHAELLIIRQASEILKTWRLNDCRMYVTLEPCPMCAGAIIQSRISMIIYGAKNNIYGSFGTVVSLQNYFPDAKNLEIINGILEDESSLMLKTFFRREVSKRDKFKNTN